MKKILVSITICISLLLVIFLILVFYQSKVTVHFTPNYQKIDITSILQQEILTIENYETLYMQTGLAPKAIDALLTPSADSTNIILDCQSAFFQEVTSSCLTHDNVTKEDFIVDSQNIPVTASLVATAQKGDILIHLSSHTLGWRNGHSGIVVDSTESTTLEAISPTANSSLQAMSKWNKYSNFILLRIKEPNVEKAITATDIALEHLIDLPYSIMVGLDTVIEKTPQEVTETHCAHLIWKAFKSQGIDLDSNGGRIVTPRDLLESDQLEVIQIYGFNPKDYIPIFN